MTQRPSPTQRRSLVIVLALMGLGASSPTFADSWRNFFTPAVKATRVPLQFSGYKKDFSFAKKNLASVPLLSSQMEMRIAQSIDPERARWIDLAARKIRLNSGLRPSDPLEKWLTLSDDAILDELLKAREFDDGLLDFVLYFYNYRPSRLKDPADTDYNGYVEAPTQYTQSIAALKAFFSASESNSSTESPKDFFRTLTSFHAPLYLSPLSKTLAKEDMIPGKTVEESRAELGKKLLAWTDTYVEKMSAPHTQPELKTICNEFLFGPDGSDKGYFDFFYRQGWTEFTNNYFMKTFWVGSMYDACVVSDIPDYPYLKEIKKLRDVTKTLMDYQPNLEPAVYPFPSMRAMREAPLEWTEGKVPNSLGIRFDIRVVPNSSTNMDRKRAAYILSRFFCDDLNPIGVQLPSEHTQDRHASDPSCMACHYKLDPMAGFFRTFGIYFHDFAGREKLTFSDFSTVNLTKYEENWKNPAGSDRVWNVGFIRSSKNAALNSYGESLEDLEKILATAPEVKECFVKRAFQYYVGEDQAASPAYLQHLASQFTSESGADHSVDAFKKLLKRILLSKTFRAQNRVTDQCYDRAPNEGTDDSLPCQVASTFLANCAQCHSGAGPAAGLNLTKMITLSDGTKNFPHVGVDGIQRSRKETLSVIIERLGSSDPMKRMPFMKEISTADRDRLFLWAQKDGN